jgi:AAA15 family ATPase/GTPase
MVDITNIEIKNFKSIRHLRIEECRRVNVFIGYPNVGKSNILEALGIYSSLLIDNNHFKFNEICRVKRFSELFFNQDTKQANQIIINEEFIAELIINQSRDLDLRIHDYKGRTVGDNVFNSTVRNSDFFYKVSKLPLEFGINLKSIRKYEFQKDILFSAQKPYSLAIPFGNNFLDVLLGNAGLRKEIAEIFEIYSLKLVLDGEDSSIKFLKTLIDGTGVTIPYHQIADTIRRLIFFKTAIQTNSNSVLLFEEPEAHVFPPYISKLTLDILSDERKNQFFISTHSPFVLNDLMEDLKKEELSIYAVGLKEGETTIKRLTEEEITEVYQYGIDLFFNLENFLSDD